MTKRGLRRLAALSITIVVVAAAIGIALVVKHRNTQRELASLRQQGIALQQSREYKEAIPLLGRYLRAVKDDPEALCAFALARREIPLPNGRHYASAISALRTAIELDPDSLTACEALLAIYREVHFYTETVEITGTILRLDPTNLDAMQARTEALLALRRDAEALTAAEALVDTHGDLLRSYDLLLAAMRQNGASGQDLVERLRAIEPRFSDSPGFYDRLSRLEYNNDSRTEGGRLDEAERLARRAATLPPQSADQVYRLDTWLRDLDSKRELTGPPGARPSTGDADEPTLRELADAMLERAFDDRRIGPELAIMATARAWWDNQDEQAAAYAARLDSLDPSTLPDTAGDDDQVCKRDAQGWSTLIAIQNRGPDDEKQLDDTIAQQPDDEWGVILRMMQALETQNPEQALGLADAVTPSNRESGVLLRYVHGLALQRIDDLLGASTLFKAVHDQSRDERRRADASLADVYARMQKFEESGEIYRRLWRSQADAAWRLIDLQIQMLENTRDPVDAQTALQAIRKAMEASPDDPSLQARLARVLILAGRTEDGLAEARAVLEAGKAPERIALIPLCSVVQQVDDQLSLQLLDAFGPGGDDADLLFAQSIIMAHAGKLAEAEAAIRAEIDKRSGDDVIPYLHTLARLFDLFDKTNAIDVYRRLSDDYPHSAAAQLGVLQSMTPWGTDHELVDNAVARLRAAAGESSLSWRIYNARAALRNDLSDKDLSEITRSLQEVLDASPDDFEALYLSAKAYIEFAARQRARGSAKEADESIDLAASFFDRAAGPSTRAYAYRPYVELLLDNNRRERANEALDRFLSETNIPPRCRAERIDLLARVGRWPEAIEDQQWFARTGQPGPVLYLANLYAASGRADDARRTVAGVLAGQSRTPDELVRAAGVYALLKDFDTAVKVLDRLPDDSDLGPKKVVIGDFLQGYRRFDLALPYFTARARSTGAMADWIQAIKVATGTASGETLDAVMAEARALFPDSPEIAALESDSGSRRSAQVYAASVGDNAPAEERELASIASKHASGQLGLAAYADQLAAFNESHPGVFPAWQLRLTALGELNRPEDAVQMLHDACAALPDDPRPRRNLAELLANLGRIDEAIEAAKAFAAIPQADSYPADVMLAQLELARFNYREVANRLAGYRSRLVSESKEAPTVGLQLYAIALAGLEEFGEVERLFDGRWDSNDGRWINSIITAMNAIPDQDWETKRAWLRRLHDTRFSLEMANKWIQIGSFSGERSDAMHAMELAQAAGDSESPEWQYVAARVAVLSDRPADAEEGFRALIDQYPDVIETYVSLAKLLASQPSRSAEAISFMEGALARVAPDTPEHQWLQVYRAQALHHAGRDAEAKDAFEQVLKADPAHLAASVGLASVMISSGDTERAAELLKRVRDPNTLDSITRTEYFAVLSKLPSQ